MNIITRRFPWSLLVAVCVAVLSGRGIAGDYTFNADICDMREAIIANPAALSTSLEAMEKRISHVSDPKTKGTLLVYCAAGLSLTNVRAAEPDVVRLAQEGLGYPLDTEDSIRALILAGNGLEAVNAKFIPWDDAKRQEVAECYLKAAKIILDKVKTLEVEPLALNESYTGDAEGGKVWEEHRENIAANNRLVDRGKEVRRRLLSLYSASPEDQEKLRGIAESVLGDSDSVRRLFDEKEGHAANPLLASPPPSLSVESFR
ncbi:MAG: hypothetical protein WCD79_10525 [Chthoniobacteraceae bacterium]